MAYEFIEYPRMLHKAGGETKIVQNDDEKKAALKAGWSIEPIVDAPEGPDEATADDPPADPLDVTQGTVDAAKDVIAGATLLDLDRIEAFEHAGKGRAGVQSLIDARREALTEPAE